MTDSIAKLDDVQVTAVTLYGEARSEPVEGQIAVASVIRNRVGKRFGKTFRDVCLAPWQFSCWKVEGGKKNHERVMALVERLAKGETVEEQPYKQCAFVAYGIVHHWLNDSVAGADHYHTAAMQPRPKWAQKAVPLKQIAGHVFYRLG
jgi:N-acetylmuramoyl-L-alanine amidase